MYISRSQRKPAPIKLELTPLIDVIFILLIFFAVSSTLVLQDKGIKLELPTAETSVKNLKGIHVTLSKNGKIQIDKKTRSLAKVQETIESVIKSNPDTPILFFADRQVDYETVIRVLDEIRLGGGSNIVLEAEKKRDG